MIDQEMLKCVLNDNSWVVSDRQPDKYYWRYEKDSSIFDFWFTTGTCRFIKDDVAKYYRNKMLEITKLL